MTMLNALTACLLGAALVCVAGLPASAQVTVYVSSGVDANRLGDLRNAQDGALEFAQTALDVPAVATDVFPAVPALRADVAIGLDAAFNVGIEVGTASTGGRVDYQDRTGQYRYDLVASRVYVGGFGEWVMHRSSAVTVASTLRNRYSASRLDLDEVLVASGQTLTRRDVTFRQVTFSLQPEVAVEIGLPGPLGVRLRAGWEQVLSLDAMTSDIEVDDLWVATTSEPRSINWSGPRLGVGLAFSR
ncbi:MAG: hypothetical protein AAF845_11660 [Bacteroidota bacterium]